MLIQEAIESGKPFRRQGWPPDDIWYIVNFPNEDMVALDEYTQSYPLEPTIQDILANDWEIKS